MRKKVYIRMAQSRRARDGWKVDASTKPVERPLMAGSIGSYEDLHTIRFCLEVEIPDELMRPGSWPQVNIALQNEDLHRVPVAVAVVAEPEPDDLADSRYEADVLADDLREEAGAE